MTRIHMQTEHVRQLANEIRNAAARMEHLPVVVRNLSRDLDSTWEGGNSDYYVREIRLLAGDLNEQIDALLLLSSQVNNEVDQWETADNNGARGLRGTLPPELRGINIGPGSFPVRYAPLPSLPEGRSNEDENGIIKDWGINVDAVAFDKWSKKNGWKEDAKIGIDAKIGLLDGAYEKGEGSGNWQVGKYDIGGAVGEYSVSQAQAGVEFGFGEDGFTAGAYGEYDLIEASGGVVLGGSLLGLTFSAAGSAGSADAFAGIKDNSVGISAGASAAAGEIGMGVNVAGANIGVNAGLSLGFEIGIKLGADTEIKAGPFKIGLSFGKAIND